MRRRKKPDWVMEQDVGAWRLYVYAVVIIALVAYIVYHFDIKKRDSSAEEAVRQLLVGED